MTNRIVEAFIDERTKLAKKDDKRWGEVIVSTPNVKLTKRDVFNYYSEPKIRRALLAQLKGREAIIRQSFKPEFVVLKRNEAGKVIRISRDKKDPFDKKDWSYYTERRTTEFHPVFKKREKQLVVDLDPQPEFSRREAGLYAKEVQNLLSDLDNVDKTHIRYSGGRGFYVVADLKKSMSVDKGREMLKSVLAPLTDFDRVTFGKPTEDDQLRIDTTPFKEKGSLRGLFSLNVDTGYVSVPVEDPETFDPKKDATIEAVLGRKPRNFPHVRA